MNGTDKDGERQDGAATGEPIPVIDSRAGFHAALRWGFAQAAARGARRILAVDRDFSAWPLDDPALLNGLTTWLRRPQRELVLLAGHFDEVPRQLPRFTAWRRQWAHAVPAWLAPHDLEAELPTLLLDDGPLLVRLIDPVHWRGRVVLDAQAARPYRDEIETTLQRCERGFPATQLGL